MQQEICNTLVDFPYNPYNIQRDYMNCVINSCQNKQLALLESPTGTGKTLSLLCSVLSWKRKFEIENSEFNRGNQFDSESVDQNNDSRAIKTQIIYCSRTHSQLSNVINELKKTVFRPTVSQIASRSRLCLVEDVGQNGDFSSQSRRCRLLRQQKKCQYANDDKIAQACERLLEPLFDMEDFAQSCKNLMACPYLVSQKIAEKSDLILTPYTYIIDPIVRSNLSPSLFRNNIVIIDEAHNFPDQCCDIFSFSLTIKMFNDVADELDKMMAYYTGKYQRGHSVHDFEVLTFTSQCLLSLFQAFKNCIDIEIGKNKYKTYPATKYYEFLRHCGIDSTQISKINGLLAQIIESQAPFGTIDINSFESVLKFLRNIFPQNRTNIKYIDDHYAISLTSEGVLNMFCFSPSIAFEQIRDLNPRTIILTSGTISPFDTFMESLGYNFPIILENPHIADARNIFVAIALSGMLKNNFHFTYQNRGNEQMKIDLASSINDAMNICPHGFLTFYSSFTFLEDFERYFRRENTSSKRIIREPRGQRLLKAALKDFERNAGSQNGASLMAVCRGKMSEGIDFSDNKARCVCVVGIPFPNLSDIKVAMHKSWLDQKKPNAGSQWYVEMAMRAVNQAIGRSIRHKNDFASVILFDQRFTGFCNKISKWMAPSIKICNTWDEVADGLKSFFNEHSTIQDNPTPFLSDESENSQNLTTSQLVSIESAYRNKESQSSTNLNSSSPNSSLDHNIPLAQKPPTLSCEEEESVSSIPNENQENSNDSSFPKAKPIQMENYVFGHAHENQDVPSFQLPERNDQEDRNYTFLTRTQKSIVAPTITKSKMAAIEIKHTFDKDEKALLCKILKIFKETRNIEDLRIGLDALESPKCREIILKTMSAQLKKEFVEG